MLIVIIFQWSNFRKIEASFHVNTRNMPASAVRNNMGVPATHFQTNLRVQMEQIVICGRKDLRLAGKAAKTVG